MNRRKFLHKAAAASLGSMLAGQFDLGAAEAAGAGSTLTPTGSDVDLLFPFIQSRR